MRAFYEKIQEESITIKKYRNTLHVFPPHFHNNVEIFIVKRGRYKVSRNNNEYEVIDNTICVFDSYDIHGYTSRLEDDFDDCVIIVPTKFILPSVKTGKIIANPLITDSVLCDKILSLADEYINEHNSIEVKTAVINLILTLINEKLQFVENQAKNDDITMRKILNYIYDNFAKDVSLVQIAKELGYTAEHLSRVFHKYIQMSIPSYINRLRVEYVEKLKTKPNSKLSNCIYEAGFNSIQTYYRARKQYDKF